MELTHTAARSGRLSSFLRRELNMSSGLMNHLKWGDGIRVNGLPQHTNYPVQPGDVITVLVRRAGAGIPRRGWRTDGSLRGRGHTGGG